jgi:hypothetical protein
MNELTNQLIDFYVFVFLSLWFAPYKIPTMCKI